MTQMSLFVQPYWTITEISHYLKELFQEDPTLQDVWVRGEISNFTRSGLGHVYFTLKDSSSALKCVLWRTSASRLTFSPRDGQAVEAHGSINIYEVQGQYQLYVDALRPAGEGALFQEFLRLKARLETEGLFAPERKRPIPQMPERIGIVTSPTGAALRDILNTLRRRYPLANIILSPTTVQGEDAPAAIVTAIQALNLLGNPDVILLARGGGSMEDLWAFNDERVVYAIAASQAPIITGVGHETDFTLADFVADLRAPTPTAAAELATPERGELLNSLDGYRQRLRRAGRSDLDEKRQLLEQLQNSLAMNNPINAIRTDRQKLDDYSRRMDRSMSHTIDLGKVHLAAVRQSLNAYNPLAVLQRGFALVTDPTGRIIHKAQLVKLGEELNIRLSDGHFDVEVQTGPTLE